MEREETSEDEEVMNVVMEVEKAHVFKKMAGEDHWGTIPYSNYFIT